MTKQNQSEIREVNITLPATRDDIESLELGDAVFLNGLVFTGREGLYHMIFDKNVEPPIDPR
ncbi:MAG: fumarate hydratase, partial [Deltaproteobacteria bacterium]|nr:fumarate hydratase [Deltaproteobacteria bacterium]